MSSGIDLLVFHNTLYISVLLGVTVSQLTNLNSSSLASAYKLNVKWVDIYIRLNEKYKQLIGENLFRS